MKKKSLKRAAAFALSVCIAIPGGGIKPQITKAEGPTVLTDEDVESLLGSSESYTRQSVHDPSVLDTGEGTYYVFGSHMGVASTTDLMNWEAAKINGEADENGYYAKMDGNDPIICSMEDAFKQNVLTGETTLYKSDGTPYTVDFGTYDITKWHYETGTKTIEGNMWAPDIIWNESLHKYCMYMSINGEKWNSAIVLLTSDNIDGPYVYQAPIVFTGFQPNNDNAELDRSYKSTDLELALAEQGIEISSLPERYSTLDTSKPNNPVDRWGEIWPHAIDPCVFYDEFGKLWMSYGSWSGGIYMLELDEKTGLRDYSVSYSSDYDSAKPGAVTSDPYFGTKIAGGYYVSGEGSYIKKIGSKYVLFMSYGFLSAAGGYEMRLFYSDKPNGPYVDTAGTSAIYEKYQMNYSPEAATNRGQKLMGNYIWENSMSIGEVSQGHNSVLAKDGRYYVIYHTRFEGSDIHQLRVHELFLNENGYVVASPYEYSENNDSIANGTNYTTSELAGSYEMIVHKYKTKCVDHGGSTEVVAPVSVVLNANGTVTGDYEGTWSYDSSKSYATLVLGGNTYKGVFAKQNITGSSMDTMCFTALDSETGVSVWGSMEVGDQVAVARSSTTFSQTIPETTYMDIVLNTEATDGVTVSWESSNPEVISNDGKLTAPESDTEVTLTAILSKGNYCYKKSYSTIAKAGGTENADVNTGWEAYYTFEGNMVNEKNELQSGERLALTKGTIPSFENDLYTQSTTLHIYPGNDGDQSSSYAKFVNPLKGKTLEGATVSIWVNRQNTEVWSSIWCFRDDDNSDGIDGRLYSTPNAYVGFNGTGGWFDANQPDDILTNAISIMDWHMFTVSFTKNEMIMYIDGIKVYDGSSITREMTPNTGYAGYGQSVMNLISSANDFYLEREAWWGWTTSLYMDNLRIYSRVLSPADVAKIYLDEKPVDRPHDITINYSYEDGSKALDTITKTISAGKSYSIVSPKINGYAPDIANVSGVMQEEDKTVNVVYKPIIAIVGDDDLSLALEDYTSFYKTEAPEGDFAYTYSFHNYSVGDLNWHNFSVIISGEKDAAKFNATDTEWYLRADRFTERDQKAYASIEPVYDFSIDSWENYLAAVKDSEVTVTVKREGTTASVEAKIEGANGGQYSWKATVEGAKTGEANVYLGGWMTQLCIYKAPFVHSLSYDLDGGKLEKRVTNPLFYNETDADFTLNNPVKEGYTFAGWREDNSVEVKTTVTITKGSTTDKSFTATWTPIEYTITYDLGNGTVEEGVNPTAYTIESDAITLTNPTRAGYTFAGWTGTDLESASTEVTIANGSFGDRSYTATWTAQDYVITYDLAGGKLEASNPEGYSADSEAITLTNPTREGYTFAGWTGTDLESASTEVTIASGSLGNRSYVATWTPVEYAITYDLAKGTAAEGANPAAYTIESEAITLSNPTREGYTFAGWTGTDLESASTEVTIASGSLGDRSYVATWTPINYTIKVDTVGGTLAGDVPESYTIESDTITVGAAEKEGYIFKGWLVNNTTEAVDTVTIAAGSTGSILLTAVWEEIIETVDSNDFVENFYENLLGRDADEEGLEHWTELLETGAVDGAGLVEKFVNSAEYATTEVSDEEYIESLYQAILGRSADESGMAHWLHVLASGATREEVMARIVNSVEFQNVCDACGIERGYMQMDGTAVSPNVRQFIERLYDDALDRDGEVNGVDYWTKKIADGNGTPQTVAKSFFQSQEFKNRDLSNSEYVEALYETYLGRSSDPEGKQHWMTKLDSGALTRDELLDRFGGSAEFNLILKSYGLQ